MTLWLPALAVMTGAIGLVWIQRRIEQSQARWIRRVVREADPEGLDRIEQQEAGDETDLATLERIPPELRPLCPAPPFVAAIYHHSCGSCRELWKQIALTGDLSEIYMVHSAARADFLRHRGILREPAIALPDEIMESLPSGMAIRVDPDWRIADIRLATTVGDLRLLLGEPAGTLDAAGAFGEPAFGEPARALGEAAGTR
jgi:hypothetical protein